ncbi:MAG: major facilitator transporter [Acidimicrobiales bacterium]|nr:major facilitator transporter [Acidimicrobiales bacterium]
MTSAPADDWVRSGTARGRWVLAATVLGSGMAMLDATVVNVALPRLATDLHADFAGLQWVITGYTLALASLILVGGALGDRFGRRRVFLVGVVWFASASLLSGLAPNIPTLVVARVLQGIGGALLTPGSLAILQASFHPDDRARAIGAWSGLAGITTAVGPFLGGWLVEAASWRWIFLLNLPLAAAVVAVTLRHVPESRDSTVTGGLDVSGAVLGALGLAGCTYGLIERSAPIGAAGVVVLVVFVLVERRRPNPMVPLDVFANRQFSAANAVTFFVYGGFGAALFLVGLVLQQALGYSPLAAGTALLPITVMMLAFSARAGAFAQRIGPRVPMTVGPLVMAAGLLLMLRIEPGSRYASAGLPAILVFASGLSLTVAPLTATVLAAADERHSGIASGINNAVARVGSLLAVAVVPIIAGFAPGASVSGHALVVGFHRTVVVAAALVALGGVLAWLFIRSNVLAGATAGDDTPVDEREPCYHCGADAPPLTVHAHADTAA